VPVKVAAVQRGTVKLTLRYPGELTAPETVDVAPEVGGRLLAVTVRMGQAVKEGQLLVRIDDAQMRSQLQEARAALQVARSALRRAEVADKTAATELSRKESLAKRDLITRQEMDNIQSRRDTAAASLAVARAQVSQAAARVGLLQKQLRDTRILSPLTGWVQARHLDPGAVVSAGKAVLRLVRKSPIVVRFKVGERHIGEIRHRLDAGRLPVQVRVDAYPGRAFSGAVARVAPALDAASRTAAVEAELPNEDGRLMPGMFCRVTLDLGRSSGALLLPLRALVTHGSGESDGEGKVFVVQGGRARLTTVQLGAVEPPPGPGQDEGERGEVLRGLTRGQQVVVEGQDGLQDGAAVQVVGRGAAPK
jgi:RND family efflux transporter MFP subunit